MKKNAMLKIAAILLVAVLLTTCAISSTFAKYVTAEKSVASNSARVAKWGLEITGTSAPDVPLFKNDYTDVKGAIEGDTGAIVVAPGTSNASDAFKLAITGTPEVDYKLTVKADLDLGDNWVAGGAYYCPLVITVGTTPINGLDCDDADEFEVAVENAIAAALLGTEVSAADDAYTKTYTAGTAAPTTAANGVAVSWAWAFEGNDNAKDTALGNAHNATIQISFSVAAEQVSTID